MNRLEVDSVESGMTDLFLTLLRLTHLLMSGNRVKREDGKQEETRRRLTEHFPYLLYLRPRSETVYR